MTNLADRITQLKFQTCDMVHERGRSRAVSIEARPRHAVVRLSGLRTSYVIPWSAVFSAAVKMHIAAERAEKLARKKAAR